jgi:hypothetical protein
VGGLNRLVGSNPTLSAPVGTEGRGETISDFEWRRKRGWLNRTLEKVEDLPYNVASGGRPLTDSAKRKLFEDGIVGQAQILKAPSERATSKVQENLGRFQVRVEIPERDPYEVTITQSFSGGYESEGLKEGALVACRVDPKNDQRVLLLAPESDQRRVIAVDSSGILAEGKRATGTIEQANELNVKAPGSGDPMYELIMEMRSKAEGRSWRVRIGQRVPAGAVDLAKEGSELTVAYLEVDEGHSAAVDWPASTGGRFS